MSQIDLTSPDSLDNLADRAEKIYEERYREDFEKNHLDEFVAIDVVSEKAFPGKFSEDALLLAQEESPDGLFHLIRVGSPAAFSIGRHG